MKKLNIAPIASNFRRSNNSNIQYTDRHHFIQFDGHTVTFKPLSIAVNDRPGNADIILQKFLPILRIYNEKHLLKLRLNFYEWSDLDTKVLSRLGSEIARYCRNIKELSLNFFNCDRVTEKGIQHLLSPISMYIKGLNAFNLSVTGFTQISKKGADHIKSLILKRARMLSKLSLIFSRECVSIGEEHFPREADVLTHLRKQKMRLAKNLIYYYNIQDYSKGALSLCNRARYYLSNLQKLNLVFPQVYNSQTLDTISLVLKNVKQLRVLYLGNIDCYLSEESEESEEDNYKVKRLINCYLRKNLTKLHYLTLTFKKYDQTLQANLIMMLSNLLPNLPELRGFTLSFKKTKQMEDQDLLEIVNQISIHAKSLESLRLELETFRNGSNGIIQILGRNLVSLKELVLNCRSPKLLKQGMVPIISSKEFPSIAQLHLYLPNDSFSFDFSGCYHNLEVLTLSFGYCVDIPEGKLGTLAPLFDYEFKNMRELTLELGQARQMTDEDIKTLYSYNWKNLSNLQQFRFGISDQEGLSNEGLEHISNFIREELNNLTSFELILRGLGSFTEIGVKDLSLTIAKNMKQLRNLGLDITSNVSREIMDIIVTQIAQHLKKLERIHVSVNSFFENLLEAEGEIDFMCEMRKKLSFIPVVNFCHRLEEND